MKELIWKENDGKVRKREKREGHEKLLRIDLPKIDMGWMMMNRVKEAG